MRPSLRQINASPALRIALVILAVAVFAWGLQYKLSLYQRPSPRSINTAKLIQGEQPGKKLAAILVRNRDTSPLFFLCGSTLLFVPAILVQWYRSAEKPIALTPPSFYSRHFIRPPPKAS